MAHNKVYGKCENFCDVEVMAKEDVQLELNKCVKQGNLALLTGTIEVNNSLSGQVQLDYPNGFSKNYTVVVSQMVTNLGSANLSSGQVRGTSVEPLVTLGDKVTVRVTLNEATTGTYDYKVVLLDTSIFYHG